MCQIECTSGLLQEEQLIRERRLQIKFRATTAVERQPKLGCKVHSSQCRGNEATDFFHFTCAIAAAASTGDSSLFALTLALSTAFASAAEAARARKRDRSRKTEEDRGRKGEERLI